jgi:predicted phage tail protein
VSVKAQDELSGGIGNVGIVSNRSVITMPNFNGSGTRDVNASNCANATFDMITNEYYGGGVSPAKFLESQWDDWKDWGDDLVDGNKRCQFNMSIDGRYSLDKSLQFAESCGRAKVVFRGTKLGVVIEGPGSHSNVYSNGNTEGGALEWLPKSGKADKVEIQYIDKDLDWSFQTVSHARSDFETMGIVPNIVRVILPGINNKEQAQREAILRSQLSEMTSRKLSFRSGLNAIQNTVGDVIAYQHPGNAKTFGGRIISCTDRWIVLDQEITLDSATYSGNCRIMIQRSSDDVLVEGIIEEPFDEETDTFKLNVEVGASRYDVFMINRTIQDEYLYRINNISRDSEIKLGVDLIEYVDGAYYHIDYDSGETAI